MIIRKNRIFTDIIVGIFIIGMFLSLPYFSWKNIQEKYKPIEHRSYAYYEMINVLNENMYCRVDYQTFFGVFILDTINIICVKNE